MLNSFLYHQKTCIHDVQEGEGLQLRVKYKSICIFASSHRDYIFSQLYLKKDQNNMGPNVISI
jgi:hypothetical protein